MVRVLVVRKYVNIFVLVGRCFWYVWKEREGSGFGAGFCRLREIFYLLSFLYTVGVRVWVRFFDRG